MNKLILSILTISSLLQSLPSENARFATSDRLYSERQSEEKARKALKMYKDMAETEKSIESLWRLSMAAQFVGMRYEAQSSAKEKLFEVGREAGRKAINLNPECGPCHFWTAVNMALYGKEVGVFKTLFTLGEVQSHLRKSADLHPSYALGGAYRILGLIERNLPGILGGSDEKAVSYLEKAIEVAPGASLNYLVLSRILRDGFDDVEKAKDIAKKGSQLPLYADAPLEEREAREEIVDLLNELNTLPKKEKSTVRGSRGRL